MSFLVLGGDVMLPFHSAYRSNHDVASVQLLGAESGITGMRAALMALGHVDMHL